MLVWIAFVAGCAIGWMRAARRGGNMRDRVQYALAHAIPLTLLTLLVLVIGARMGWLPEF
ncbi:MAG TPA: hypothetical protein VLA52_08985 [Thermohalobaculum sp.]|nr:hypothetical protein [Thermohalobaculum sp.]